MVRQEGLERPLFAGQAPPGGRLILRSVAGQRLPALGALLADSLADGRHTVRRLIAEWQDGGDRFAGPGKRLLVAWWDGRPAACGGRTLDPDPAAPDVGRLRRF